MLCRCAVIDLCGRMVLACRIGGDMAASRVRQTIRDAMITEKVADGLASAVTKGSNAPPKHPST